MIQIYFLSVLCNALAGYALFSEGDSNVPDIRLGFSFSDAKSRLILGIIAMAIGVLKLLSSVQGDLPVLGDLLPAAAGLISGFALIIEYFRNNTTVVRSEDEKQDFNLVLFRNRKIIGISALVVATLHFLFPGILFL